jgi:hypothetical protein
MLPLWNRPSGRDRDRRRRIGTGLPSSSTSRFACWYVRPTDLTIATFLEAYKDTTASQIL